MDKLLEQMIRNYRRADRQMYDDPELWVDRVGKVRTTREGEHILLHHSGMDLSCAAKKYHYDVALEVSEKLNLPKPQRVRETKIRTIVNDAANAMGYNMEDLDNKTVIFSPQSA